MPALSDPPAITGLSRSKVASRRILRWYARHGRRLPWRDIRDPYKILIAEIMLHQTQVNRVLRLYAGFLKRFPTFRALASARQSEVVVAWKGMGYNNRAVRLHRLAKELVDQRNGRLPRHIDEWQELPGIGKYTAHALVVSVYRDDQPVVDVNIRRVFSRLFWKMRTTDATQRDGDIWALAAQVIPRRRGYRWMQALMDLGATICTARSPRCGECPVSSICASRLTMTAARPVQRKQEPSMHGIPNRIYRGRIVETLRTSPRPLLVRQIGPRLLPDYGARHRTWLRKLIEGLSNDGLVSVRGELKNPAARVQLA